MRGLKVKPTYESLIGVAWFRTYKNFLTEMLNSCVMDLF